MNEYLFDEPRKEKDINHTPFLNLTIMNMLKNSYIQQ